MDFHLLLLCIYWLVWIVILKLSKKLSNNNNFIKSNIILQYDYLSVIPKSFYLNKWVIQHLTMTRNMKILLSQKCVNFHTSQQKHLTFCSSFTCDQHKMLLKMVFRIWMNTSMILWDIRSLIFLNTVLHLFVQTKGLSWSHLWKLVVVLSWIRLVRGASISLCVAKMSCTLYHTEKFTSIFTFIGVLWLEFLQLFSSEMIPWLFNWYLKYYILSMSYVVLSHIYSYMSALE